MELYQKPVLLLPHPFVSFPLVGKGGLGIVRGKGVMGPADEFIHRLDFLLVRNLLLLP